VRRKKRECRGVRSRERRRKGRRERRRRSGGGLGRDCSWSSESDGKGRE
jgi:hypothetical protein